MLGSTCISRILFLLLVLFCCSARFAYAAVQPYLALYDIRHSKVISVTEWREIDFGDRSSIAPGQQPASVYALHAKLSIIGRSTQDKKDMHEYALIPYCKNRSKKISSTGSDICSLRPYKGYVMLRFHGGWEMAFSASIWRDVTPNLKMMNVLRSFQTATKDSSMTFPFSLDGSGYSESSNDLFRRYESIERCNDLTDECFQERYMSYTSSFKDFVRGQFTGRLLFYLGLKGIKELGVRLSYSNPVNENRRTILYDDEVEGFLCPFLHHLMLATQESLMKLFMLLWKMKDICSYPFILLTRRREGRSQLDVTVEAADVSREVEMREAHTRADGEQLSDASGDSNDEKDDDSEHQCRICRCSQPSKDLFAPCSCDGSAKYVHKECLEKWRELTSNDEHRRVCAECKTPYVFVLERTPLSTNYFNSPVCVPVCEMLFLRLSSVLFFVLLLWVGGYYLKLGMFLFTGFDEGVIWSAANVYHWVLGLYFITALGLNIAFLEYVLQDYTEAWQQLLVLIVSVCLLEIPLSYVGRIVLLWFLNTALTLEVSYGVGIMVAVILYIEVIPYLNEHLQSISTVREVVAPRRGRNDPAEPV